MAKTKAEVEEVEDLEEVDEVNPVEVNLDRCFTYEGRHFGPGPTFIRFKDQETTNAVARTLRTKMKILQEKEADQRNELRKDRAITGIVEKGTDAVIDNGPEEDDDEESVANELFVYKDKQVKASELFELSNKKLEKGGLSKKQIKRVRELEKQAEEEREKREMDEERESVDEGAEEESSEESDEEKSE